MVGKTLKKIRKASGITQKQLAEQLNVQNNWISQVENDHKRASPKLINEMSDALGVPVGLVAVLEYDFPNMSISGKSYVKSTVQELIDFICYETKKAGANSSKKNAK